MHTIILHCKAKFEDTKEVFRGHKSKKNILYNNQKERTTIETKIYKTRHRKLKIEQHEPNINQDVHTDAKYYSQNYRYRLSECLRKV